MTHREALAEALDRARGLGHDLGPLRVGRHGVETAYCTNRNHWVTLKAPPGRDAKLDGWGSYGTALTQPCRAGGQP